MKNPDFFHFSFLPSGEMIFGGRNQIVLANPTGLRRNREKPQAYISEVQVLNQPYNLAAMGDGKVLNLKHGQNYFSISFSARAYTIPGDVRFRYRLAGFDDWTETNGRRFANYTNVPGGDYVFELQTANNEGEWTNQLVKLPIHIHIPYWKKAWFQGLVIALLLLGAFCIYRYRVAAIRRKDKLRSEYEKKLANVEMSALLAQMNPHFLFNSLNSIDSYIIKNESTKASEYLNNFARLMRLILQNSRSNYISLKEELEALDLYLQMESLRFRDKFDYHIQVDEQLNTESIVLPPLLIQPYVENAIWHGLMHKQKGEKGKVDLQLSRKENVIHCVIEDNGIGRERALEIRASKHGPRRPSMGMQITRDRMEMINKLYNTTTNVQVTDLKDQENRAIGTRVELTIPI
jgi:two-component sensor histidine kinase